MDISHGSVLVTGAASGLGAATARRLRTHAAGIVLLDLPDSLGAQLATELDATFIPADVTNPDEVSEAVSAAASIAPLRAVVHCAGRGGPVRLVDRNGEPGSLEIFESVVRVNLIGTFNVLRLAAAAMARSEPVDGERGVCVLTASVAAWEGQIGQIPYASAKAGIVGMTLVAARDLASKLIRVNTVAPGLFDTPILARVSEAARTGLAEAIPHPKRLGAPDEFAALAEHIIGNPMLNGESIRLDGAIRMPPR